MFNRSDLGALHWVGQDQCISVRCFDMLWIDNKIIINTSGATRYGLCIFFVKCLYGALYICIFSSSSITSTTTIIIKKNFITKCSYTSSFSKGTGDIVAVMITESFGKDILGFLEKNQTVLVSVMVGSRGLPKNINRGSLVFVSISFIVLMIISSAWLIFYFIQKIRDTSARDRSQVLNTHSSFEENTHKPSLTLKLAAKTLPDFSFKDLPDI